MGLLNDDNEWHAVLKENESTASASQLRSLFVHIVVHYRVTDIRKLWDSNWKIMSDDILYRRRKETGRTDIDLPDEVLEQYTLAEVEKILNSIRKSIDSFPNLPTLSDVYRDSCRNRLLFEEQSYNRAQMSEEHDHLVSKLNNEQRRIYNSVLDSVYNGKGQFFFVYGSGGCGKTYLWKIIIARLRSEYEIVLPVALSGIAATLLQGGHTAHSRFKIPLKLDESSTCAIRHNSDIAELCKQTSLIIWDEAPMQNRYTFECLDRTLRDIMKSVDKTNYDKPFGGITMLLGGDFRQILPVVSKDSRADIVSECIFRSPLWSLYHIFTLSQNMRVNSVTGDNNSMTAEQFTTWVLDIGNGVTDSCDSEDTTTITIPDQFCIKSSTTDISLLIDNVFPDLTTNFTDKNFLRERAILTPRNKVVDHVNGIILDKIPGQSFTFNSVNSARCPVGGSEDLTSTFPVEILNSIKLPGMPPHELILKENVVVMLLRNINQAMGLCNGTRMVVRKCLKHSIVCEIISGSHNGDQHVIPRLNICPTDTDLPFDLVRLQFPIQICFVMTVNKAQGQSLDRVGLYLPEAVFCHGQLYVTISRVTSPSGLIMYIERPQGGTTNVTENVVYDEVFYYL